MKTLEAKGFFSIWNKKINHKCLSHLFPIHLNTYVIGLRPLLIFFSYSAGSDLSRQNKVDLRAVRVEGYKINK